ncbi:MAG: YceI family protein [Bacteroidetes bacterium]|nr:YceI family protein [Bacteroidota bacterium]
MKNAILSILYFTTILSSQLFAQISLDSNIQVRFSIQSFGYGKVEGEFLSLTGTADFDEENIAASNLDFEIKTTFVETGSNLVNNFVSNEDFFSVEKYPTISFQSTNFSKTGNVYAMTGDLTIKGITKKIRIPFEMKEINDEINFIGGIQLNRFDFNLGENYGRFWIKESVAVELEAVFPQLEKCQSWVQFH